MYLATPFALKLPSDNKYDSKLWLPNRAPLLQIHIDKLDFYSLMVRRSCQNVVRLMLDTDRTAQSHLTIQELY